MEREEEERESRWGRKEVGQEEKEEREEGGEERGRGKDKGKIECEWFAESERSLLLTRASFIVNRHR